MDCHFQKLRERSCKFALDSWCSFHLPKRDCQTSSLCAKLKLQWEDSCIKCWATVQNEVSEKYRRAFALPSSQYSCTPWQKKEFLKFHFLIHRPYTSALKSHWAKHPNFTWQELECREKRDKRASRDLSQWKVLFSLHLISWEAEFLEFPLTSQ